MGSSLPKESERAPPALLVFLLALGLVGKAVNESIKLAVSGPKAFVSEVVDHVECLAKYCSEILKAFIDGYCIF